MKKCFITFILALTLGLMLASCGTPLTPSTVTPAAETTGITLKTQFPVYAKDVEFIQFRIENNSGEMAEFGTMWTLERQEDGIWYSVPFAPDTGWTMPLIMLSDGGVTSDTVHLSMLDHKLKDGTYRIVKEINGTPYTAEFTVGDSPVGKDSPYSYAPLASLPENYTVEMAERDGVVIPDASADLSRFFDDIAAGMNTQLRFAENADGGIHVTDLTVEFVLGSMRIGLTDGLGNITRYGAYFVADGTDISIQSHAAVQDHDRTRMPLRVLNGNLSALEALQSEDGTAIASYRRAAFWSEDGNQLLTLSAEPMSPLDFGISVQYEDGGSAGHTVTLDTPGMKAIRSAMWSGENTVMLICDVEDSSPSGMTGYVFYDTAEDQVLGYTQSQYEPTRQADGSILIPE